MPARRLLLILSAAIAAVLVPAVAYAHGGHDRALTLAAWTWDPTVILGLVAALGLYLYGLGRLSASERAEALPWRAALFFGGLATVFLALESPLDLAGDEYLFTFHMLQHQLLMMVAAPLLLLGTPPTLLRRLLEGRAARPVAELVTSAPFAFLAFNATVWAWHAPALYETALRHENVHILQHLTFLATAVLFWWPVIGLAPAARVGRGLSIGGRMAYLGLAIVSDATLGFIIGFWPDVLYPFYEEADRLWGLSALADQQIGAAVMGAINSAIFFLVLSVLFFALLEEEERTASTTAAGR